MKQKNIWFSPILNNNIFWWYLYSKYFTYTQSNLLKNVVEFNDKSRPRSKEGRIKKETLMIKHMLFKSVEN